MEMHDLYSTEQLSEAALCANAKDDTALQDWWDVHTHRFESDWQHTIFNLPNNVETFVQKAEHESLSRSSAMEVDACKEAHYVSVGIHPWYLTEANREQQIEQFRELLLDSRVVAIGEAGVDKTVETSLALQCEVFEQVAVEANERNLPLLIHSVKSSNEIIRIKKRLHPQNPWIIHGFRGKKELAQSYLQQGIYLSFGERYQEAALRVTPLNFLFLETDESCVGIYELYRRAAKILDISDEKLGEMVQQNINKLFFRQ